MQAELINTLTLEDGSKIGEYDTHILFIEGETSKEWVYSQITDATRNYGELYGDIVVNTINSGTVNTVKFRLKVGADEELPAYLTSSDERITAELIREDYGDHCERDSGHRYGYLFRIAHGNEQIGKEITVAELYERFKESMGKYTADGKPYGIDIRRGNEIDVTRESEIRKSEIVEKDGYWVYEWTNSTEIWFFTDEPIKEEDHFVDLGFPYPRFLRRLGVSRKKLSDALEKMKKAEEIAERNGLPGVLKKCKGRAGLSSELMNEDLKAAYEETRRLRDKILSEKQDCQ